MRRYPRNDPENGPAYLDTPEARETYRALTRSWSVTAELLEMLAVTYDGPTAAANSHNALVRADRAWGNYSHYVSLLSR